MYLLREGVRLTAEPYSKEVLQDPNAFYDTLCLLTRPHGTSIKGVEGVEGVEPFEGITEFYIGSKQYTLGYTPRPEQKFERLSRFDKNGKDRTGSINPKHRVDRETGKTPLHVVAHGKRQLLRKQDYVSLMRRVGKQRGFAEFKSKVLVSR